MESDEVAVLEAAYRLDGTEAEWLGGLAAAAAPMLDEGLGLVAWTWTLAAGQYHLRAMETVGGGPGLAGVLREAALGCDRRILKALCSAGPCVSLRMTGADAWVRDDGASRELLGLGAQDCLAVVAPDSGRHLVALTAYRATPTLPSQRMVSRWSRVASHLAAGFRVRRALAACPEKPRPDPLTEGDAVLTPAGRTEHSRDLGERSRRALARAVLSIQAARGAMRTEDPDAALEAWKGLVAGRWSLIDHVDTDGKRFLVAKENRPDATEPAALNPRERQVLASRARGCSLKLIAYDLGVSISSISKSLKAGMMKLGMSCEADLASLSRAVESEMPRS